VDATGTERPVSPVLANRYWVLMVVREEARWCNSLTAGGSLVLSDREMAPAATLYMANY
jgi:hypothetical protein